MTTTFPLSTLACSVTTDGITAPSYSDIYQSLQASFQSIYGSDVIITPDSQDGQLLAVFARAIYDCNIANVAVFNSFSPATSQGTALSNNVKLNGIARNVSSFSTAVLYLVGQVGAVINNGVVGDGNSNRWALPASVTIPLSGDINVTATCQTPGAVEASANTITQIMTPSLGWQTATNPGLASAGAPVESDADLRQRQTISVALPSLTVLQGIIGAVASLVGVSQVRGFENDTGTTDARGLPPHSIALVVLGGDAAAIASAIYSKKTPGAYTDGTTYRDVADAAGIMNRIRFYIPTEIPIKATVTIHALTGYTSAIADQIKVSVRAYINALKIGNSVYISRLYLPAQLYGGLGMETFEITSIQISIAPAVVGSSDIAIAFKELATCLLSDLTVVVV